jgi:hypothetical protein
MQSPRIAVIDLSSPALSQPHKILSAAEALEDLKAKGQASWTRYKGHTGTDSLIAVTS